MEKFTENGVVRYRSSCGNHTYNEDQVVWSKVQQRFILKEYAWLLAGEHGYVSQRYTADTPGYYRVARCYLDEPVAAGEDNGFQVIYFDDEDPYEHDYVHCEDTGRWIHSDRAHYSEYSETAYEFRENDNYNACEEGDCDCDCGEREEYNDDSICGYHASSGQEIRLSDSLACVGYEIEKTKFVFADENHHDATSHADFVGSHTMMRGYEYDGSCGVEAITHILPAHEVYESANGNIVDVRELFDDASEIIDSPWSTRCGGHFTVSYGNMSSADLLATLREYLPIFYGLFPKRLKNSYCNRNAKLNSPERWRGVVSARYNALEMRLPSAVTDVDQLWFRHQIICRMMHHAFALKDSNWEAFLIDIDAILAARLSKDKKRQVLRTAKSFRNWIVKDIVSMRVASFNPIGLSRADQEATNECWSRYARIRVNKRRFRKPLKLGGYFYIKTPYGNKRVTLTDEGLKYQHKLIHLDPSTLNLGTCLPNGDKLTWECTWEKGRILRAVPTAVVQPEPEVNRVLAHTWQCRRAGTNIVQFGRVYEAVNPDTTWIVRHNLHATNAGFTVPQAVKKYGSIWLSVERPVRFDEHGRIKLVNDPKLITILQDEL